MRENVEVTIASDKLKRILDRTNKKNPAREDIAALQKALKEYPDLWRKLGDLARLIGDLIIDHTGGSIGIKSSIKHGVEAIRKDLGYDEASGLEKLLIEQIGLAWLNYHTTHWNHQSTLKGGTSFKNAAYWERRLNGAHRRYLRAIETLVRIRKVGPAVQINIAEKQVNQVSH